MLDIGVAQLPMTGVLEEFPVEASRRRDTHREECSVME